MKITLNELRKIIRSVIREVNFPGRPTGFDTELNSDALDALGWGGLPSIDPEDTGEDQEEHENSNR